MEEKKDTVIVTHNHKEGTTKYERFREDGTVETETKPMLTNTDLPPLKNTVVVAIDEIISKINTNAVSLVASKAMNIRGGRFLGDILEDLEELKLLVKAEWILKGTQEVEEN